MKSREFHIPTTWRVRGSSARVFDLLSKPEASLRARGDVEGHGAWRIDQDGEWTEARYDWTVLVTQPWMAAFAPLLEPVFVANHRWAMRRGLEGPERELARGDR